jgi:hypothetical protein
MRPWSDINADLLEQSKVRAKELAESEMLQVMREDEIVVAQYNARVSKKVGEMIAILTVLDNYLKYNSIDGRAERQPLRKELRQMLDAL